MYLGGNSSLGKVAYWTYAWYLNNNLANNLQEVRDMEIDNGGIILKRRDLCLKEKKYPLYYNYKTVDVH